MKVFLLMLAIGNIIYALLMAAYLRTGTADLSMRVWTWAKAVEGCAYLAFSLRPELPPVLGKLVANGLLIGAAAAQTSAYCMSLGYRWQRPLLAVAVIAELLLLGTVVLDVSLTELAVWMSLSIAVLTGAGAFVLLAGRRNLVTLRWVIGIPNLLISLAFVVRAWIYARDGTLTLFSPGPTQTMMYLVGYLLLIVNGFGFLLLCKQKDERQLRALATADS